MSSERDPRFIGDMSDDLNDEQYEKRLEAAQLRWAEENGRHFTDREFFGLNRAFMEGWVAIKEDGTVEWVDNAKLIVALSMVEVIEKDGQDE